MKELAIKLKDIGVNIRNAFGSYKSTVRLLKEISKKWDKLESGKQNEIKNLLAGDDSLK